MATYFADAQVQKTFGDRGKTTRRRSTRTVRGAEGRWIAQAKEDMKSRPAGWLVKCELLRWKRFQKAWVAESHTYGRFDTEEQALAWVVSLKTGPETALRDGCGQEVYRSRVWAEREE